jgi:hypothetical protein
MMSRTIGLITIGFGLLYHAWRLLSVPLAVNAPERTIELYKQFGAEGVAHGAASLGAAAIALGLYFTLRIFGRRRRR